MGHMVALNEEQLTQNSMIPNSRHIDCDMMVLWFANCDIIHLLDAVSCHLLVRMKGETLYVL